MSKLKCVCAVYDTLEAGGLSVEHSSFDDLIMACVALAVDPCERAKDVVEFIALADPDRDDVMVALDLVEYAKGCGLGVDDLEKLTKAAIQAGKAGWRS